METALVSVSMGVMKPFLSKLTNLLGEEYVKFKGVRKKIEFLRDELEPMSVTLQMLADAEELSPQMKYWRDKLRELTYDIEDCVDAFMVRVDHDGPKGFRRFARKLKKLKARHDIANEIEELKKRVMEVSERHKRYNFVEQSFNYSASVVDPRKGGAGLAQYPGSLHGSLQQNELNLNIFHCFYCSKREFSVHDLCRGPGGPLVNPPLDPRLPAFYEEIDRLVGIGGPKKHIIELLTMERNGSSAKLKVVSIAGCGGLGKTTLAKHVYDTVKSQFSCAAFVSVSRSPDLRKILVQITKGVRLTDSTQDDDEQQLVDTLREHLQDRRYLVVIDDIWLEKAWETIKLALPNNDLGSRIITTTRSVTVAKCCSSQNRYVYEMEPLSFDDSKRLFFKRVFGCESPCYPHLEDVPDRILRKCGGLPLAIITVSSMLTNVCAKEDWDRVLSAIGSALARILLLRL